MAWNFGTGAGCVSFSPIVSTGSAEFGGLTVDFNGGGTICSIYDASETTFLLTNAVPRITVTTTQITYFHRQTSAPVQSEWNVSIPAGWHHLNLYTDSEGRSPICILDGVDLGLGVVISNGLGLFSNQGGPWVIGGYRLGSTYIPDFSGQMAHFSWWGAASSVGFDGVTRFRDMLRVHRLSPLYIRDFSAGGNEDPGQIVYVPMADEVDEEISDVTAVPFDTHGTVTREDDAPGWWVIGRMNPYDDLPERFLPPVVVPPTSRIRNPCPQYC